MSPLRIHLSRAWLRAKTRLSVAFGGHDMKVRLLRAQGTQIGKHCRIHTDFIGGEPYLIRVGGHVTITSKRQRAYCREVEFDDISVRFLTYLP